MSNALTKITTRAKQIRKGKPNMAWSAAVKAAGVDYRAGRLGKVAGTAKPKTVKKVAGTKKKIAGTPVRVVRGIGKVSTSPGKKVTGAIGAVTKGEKVIAGINKLEKKLKGIKEKEHRQLLITAINAEHDKLDAIRKSISK